MQTATKTWHLLPHDAAGIEQLATTLRVGPVVAQLLLNRGISQLEQARRFLDAPLNGLHRPQLLPGISDAVQRIQAAVKSSRRICVYGDYDADGITGTAILWQLLHLLGNNASFYVPH